LDSGGNIIGINTAIFTRTGTSAGVGFAIPIDTVAKLVPQLIVYGKVCFLLNSLILDSKAYHQGRSSNHLLTDWYMSITSYQFVLRFVKVLSLVYIIELTMRHLSFPYIVTLDYVPMKYKLVDFGWCR
jgi:hypothetical protein